MKRLTVLITGTLLTASCSQLTTNKDELAELQSAAEYAADDYVACIVENSLRNATATVTDVASIVQVASTACQTEMDLYTAGEQEYLSAQVMMTEKPLKEAIDALKARASSEAGAALIAAASTSAGSAAAETAAVAATGTAAATSTVAAPARSQAAPEQWNAEQRVYLDCMEDQARKYAALNESAGVIADVAQSRCKSYMTGPGAGALQQEGRTLVLGTVLDAKLQGDQR